MIPRTQSEAVFSYVSRGYDRYKARRKQSYTLEKLDVHLKHKLISRKRADLLRAQLNASFVDESPPAEAPIEEKEEVMSCSATSILALARSCSFPCVQSLTSAVLSGFQRYVWALLQEANRSGTVGELREERDQFGRGPLHYAALLGELNATRELMENGWGMARDSMGRTPMHYAALGNKASIIELILSKPSHQFPPASNNSVTVYIETKQLSGALRDMEKFYEADLVTPRFNYEEKTVDMQDSNGRTPLHLAVLSGHYLSVQALCAHHANPLLQDNAHKRAMDLSPTVQITHFLLFHLRLLREEQTHVSYDIRDLQALSPLQINEGFIGPNGDTFLIAATRAADLQAVLTLLEKGAECVVSDKRGYTPVHVAARSDRIDLLQALLDGDRKGGKKGPLPAWTWNLWQAMDRVTKKGYTLLHICALFSSPEMLQFVCEAFIRRGRLLAGNRDLPPGCSALEYKAFHAIMETQCQRGFTPFLLAAREQRLEQAKILVRHNCDIYKKTNLLQNALHLAAMGRSAEAIDYLLYLDSDYNILKNESDYKARRPKDLDTTNHSFLHPWDLVKSGKVDQLLELVREGKVDINASTHVFRNSLLHIALMCKQIFCVRELIKLGANPKQQNAEGLTAFDVLSSLKDARYEQIASRLLVGEANLSTSEISIEQIERLYLRKDPLETETPVLEKEGQIAFDTDVFYILTEMRDALLYRKLSICDIFEAKDLNRDFHLSQKEFAEAVQWLGMTVPYDHFQKLIASLDPSGRGRVSYSRLVAHFQELMKRVQHYQELDEIFRKEEESQAREPNPNRTGVRKDHSTRTQPLSL